MIKVVLSNKRGVILSGTVCYSKLAKYQECPCEVELLKPGGALKFLQNLDSVNVFNDSESVGFLLMRLSQNFTHCLFNAMA